MPKGSSLCAVLISFLLCVVANVPPAERQALVDLYHSAGGEKWTRSENWLKGDPCEHKWFGIHCSPPEPALLSPFKRAATGDHVYTVELAGNNLIGTLEESFGDLTYVQWIALDIFNQLSGPLPQSIGNLTEVTMFTIAGSINGPGDKFSGAIPQGICKMKNLIILHFGSNKFTSIPTCFCDRKIPNCSLGGNPLKCPIPSCAKQACGATCA